MKNLLFDVGPNAGFLAERKRRADLDAGRAETQRFGQLADGAVRTREPEGQFQFTDFFQLHHVARAVNGFALGVQLHRPARRRVVTTGGFALDDEAVDLAAGFARERHGQRGRGDDAEEIRTFQRRGLATAKCRRVKGGMKFLAGQRAFDVNFQLDGFAARQPVQHTGDGAGNARAHQHIIHARKHRAENRGQRGELEFFQKVDADQSRVAFLGQKHFRKIGRDGQRHKIRAGRQAGQRREFEGRVGGLAAEDEIVRENFGGHAGHGKVFQRVAYPAIEIADLQPADENGGERGAGDHAQLAGLRNRARQVPVRDACAHSALDDLWM